MSSLVVTKQGKIDMVLTNQVEMSPEQVARLRDQQDTVTQLEYALNKIREDYEALYAKLMDDPKWAKLAKMKKKMAMVKKKLAESKVVLDYQYDVIMQQQGVEDIGEHLYNALPDPEPESEQRKLRGRK